METSEKLLMTLDETCQVLGLKPTAVRGLINKGILLVSPHAKRNRLITRASVIAFVDSANRKRVKP